MIFLIFFINLAISKKFILLNKNLKHKIINENEIKYFNDFLHIEEDKIVEPLSSCEKYSWATDRLNQKKLPLDRKTLQNDKIYGKDIDVYVIDTGVNINHSYFNKKPIWFANLGDSIENDTVGHGTHVAGIISGINVGVSIESNIYSIKISINNDGISYCSIIIDAINLIIENMKKTNRKSVINLSYGVCKSVILKLNEFMDMGGIANIAAGNSNIDNCLNNNYGYNFYDKTKGFIVGSTTSNDEISYFSNYGECVNMYAPGSSILSLKNSNNNECVEYSGTSMASPYVAGVVAAYWSLNKDKDNVMIVSMLNDNSIKNILKSNKIIHNNKLIFLYVNSFFTINLYIVLLIIFLIFILLIIIYFSFLKCVNNNIINNEEEESDTELSVKKIYDIEMQLEGKPPSKEYVVKNMINNFNN